MTLDRAPYLVRITVPPRVADVDARPTTAVTRRDLTPNGLDTEVHAEVQQADGTWQSARERGRRRRHRRVPGDAGAERTRERRARTASACAPPTRPAAPSRRAWSSRSRRPEPPPSRRPPTAPPARHRRRRRPDRVTVAPVPVQGKSVVLTRRHRHRAHQGARPERLHDARQRVRRAGRLAHRHQRPAASCSRRAWAARPRPARFHGGKFRVTQARIGHDRARRSPGALACSAARRAARRRGRRSRSRRSAACGARTAAGASARAARAASRRCAGPRWLTEDTCAGTRVRVARGRGLGQAARAAARSSSSAPASDSSRRAPR